MSDSVEAKWYRWSRRPASRVRVPPDEIGVPYASYKKRSGSVAAGLIIPSYPESVLHETRDAKCRSKSRLGSNPS